MHFDLPQEVVSVLSRLEICGFEAYAVGGCIRDYLLNIPPHEFDICTSARPEEVNVCFDGEKILATGLKHGTVTLFYQGYSLEITTFRSDGNYSDHRHPDHVRFSTSLGEDLKRRDFTVNAMAYSPARGFIDPFCGEQACHDKLLIAVGCAKTRFREDALRILRAMRFASTLDFHIEDKTRTAMMTQSPGLKTISRERIGSELNQILMGVGAARVLRCFGPIMLDVLPQLTPLLQPVQIRNSHFTSLWDQSLEVMQYTPKELSIRWAALLHKNAGAFYNQNVPYDSESSQNLSVISAQHAADCLKSLRQSNNLQQDVFSLVLNLEEQINEKNLQKWLSVLGLPLIKKLLTLQHAIYLTSNSQKADISNTPLDLIPPAEKMVEEKICLSLRDLKINGDMLLKAGLPSGPMIGQTLNFLFDKVLCGQIKNDRDQLMNLALEYSKMP